MNTQTLTARFATSTDDLVSRFAGKAPESVLQALLRALGSADRRRLLDVHSDNLRFYGSASIAATHTIRMYVEGVTR